ncbi:uncharacterized protein GGS22DRAFT_174066, partial [Annulohypoxylon maeteangense]|uniref:uncharacterized protein n=1 Tax=Annulohypoxylon maeteangense TaxID=1927788 RepID=UPI002007C39F
MDNVNYSGHSAKVGRHKSGFGSVNSHLTLFPHAEQLRSTRPDLVAGYCTEWIDNALCEDNELAVKLQSACQITSEGTIFPYLFLEIKANDVGDAAEDQLATCCAASLAVTKDLFPIEDNIVYSLAIGRTTAQLRPMWIDTKLPRPRYILGRSIFFLLTRGEDIRLLQDTVMNIHQWGLGRRLNAVTEHVKAALEAGIENYAFYKLIDL